MSDLTRCAAVAAAGALNGLLPIGKLHGAGRVAYVTIPGALGAGAATYLLREETVKKRAAVGALTGGALMLGQSLAVTLDRAAVGWLQRRGVTRPSLVIAAASAVLGAVVEYLDDDERPAADT